MLVDVSTSHLLFPLLAFCTSLYSSMIFLLSEATQLSDSSVYSIVDKWTIYALMTLCHRLLASQPRVHLGIYSPWIFIYLEKKEYPVSPALKIYICRR